MAEEFYRQASAPSHGQPAHGQPARQEHRRRRHGRSRCSCDRVDQHGRRLRQLARRYRAASTPAADRLPSTRPRSSPASSPADPLMQEEIFGPVLVGTTFRTPAEAVQLANNTALRAGGDGLVRERQPRARRGAEAGGGRGLGQRHQHVRRRRPLRRGARKSGFGREGGWEGLSAYLRPPQPKRQVAQAHRTASRRRRRSGGWHRPDPEALYRRQSGPPRRRLFPTVTPRKGRRKLLGQVGHRQPQGHPQRGRGGAGGRRRGRRPPAMPQRPDPLLHGREPLGPRHRFRRTDRRP